MIRADFSDTLQIPRVARVSAAEFQSGYVDTGRPVVVEDGAADWSAVSRWSVDHLRKECGHRPVMVEDRQDDHRQYERWTEMKLSKFIDRVEGGEERLYFGHLENLDRLPEISTDYHTPKFLPPSDGVDIGWLGKNTYTGLHFHLAEHTLLTQVFGRKRVLLIAPEAYHALDPEPWYSPLVNWSRLDASRPLPTQAARRIRDVNVFETTLEPGESLYIPLHWWHIVEGFDWNCSVAYFWRVPVSPRNRTPIPKRMMLGAALMHGVYAPLSKFSALEDVYYRVAARIRGNPLSKTAENAKASN